MKAKLSATPKSFREALEIVQGNSVVKLGPNTVLESFTDGARIDLIAVRFYDTQIVKFWADGRVALSTGGHRTVTTANRINEFITGKVYQKGNVWYFVRHRGELGFDWDNPVEFSEGLLAVNPGAEFARRIPESTIVQRGETVNWQNIHATKRTFRTLAIGDTFDFIDESKPEYNSFYRRCVKVSPRKYQAIDEPKTVYTVGSVSARVYHVVEK